MSDSDTDDSTVAADRQAMDRPVRRVEDASNVELPEPEPYRPKEIDITVSGYPHNAALKIYYLGKRLADNYGNRPFTFYEYEMNKHSAKGYNDKPVFSREDTIIKDIMVFPMGTDGKVPWQSHRLAWIEIYEEGTDSSGPYTVVKFTCDESEWPYYEGRWEQLRAEFASVEKAGKTVDEAKTASALDKTPATHADEVKRTVRAWRQGDISDTVLLQELRRLGINVSELEGVHKGTPKTIPKQEELLKLAKKYLDGRDWQGDRRQDHGPERTVSRAVALCKAIERLA